MFSAIIEQLHGRYRLAIDVIPGAVIGNFGGCDNRYCVTRLADPVVDIEIRPGAWHAWPYPQFAAEWLKTEDLLQNDAVKPGG